MAIAYQTINSSFAVAPQLQAEDMAAVAAAGFKAIIINRPDGEGGATQPSAAVVSQAAEAAGLQACYQPVTSGSVSQADIQEFARLIKTLPAPVLAYCRSGARCTQLYQAALASNQL